MILFCDRGCPFAHRVLALLEHLERPPDLRQSMVGKKPEGLRRYSASRRLPLLVDGDLVLTESRVMIEHIAERYELPDAYPAALGARSRHRHAMAIVDDFVAPLLFGRADAEVDGPRLSDGLRILEDATATGPPDPRLLAFHLAPIWLRFLWWHPTHAVTRAVKARSVLCDWLDAAGRLESLKRTAYDRATTEEDVKRARRAGLLPPATERRP